MRIWRGHSRPERRLFCRLFGHHEVFRDGTAVPASCVEEADWSYCDRCGLDCEEMDDGGYCYTSELWKIGILETSWWPSIIESRIRRQRASKGHIDCKWLPVWGAYCVYRYFSDFKKK